MTKQRISHILGLLGTIAIPLLTVWGDAGTELPVKSGLDLEALRRDLSLL